MKSYWNSEDALFSPGSFGYITFSINKIDGYTAIAPINLSTGNHTVNLASIQFQYGAENPCLSLAVRNNGMGTYQLVKGKSAQVSILYVRNELCSKLKK